MEAPWTHTPDEVLDYYRVDVGRGLSETQIVEHALKYGKNGEYCLLYIFSPSFVWCYSSGSTANKVSVEGNRGPKRTCIFEIMSA